MINHTKNTVDLQKTLLKMEVVVNHTYWSDKEKLKVIKDIIEEVWKEK